MPNGPKKDGIVFGDVTRLALFGHEWRLHLNSIMVFFPNLVELELEAKETWGPADARSISNNTLLKRLIVNEVNFAKNNPNRKIMKCLFNRNLIRWKRSWNFAVS